MARLPAADLVSTELNVNLHPLPEDRTLGVHYNPKDDVFRFKLRKRHTTTAKREILRNLAGLTDLVGWFAPVNREFEHEKCENRCRGRIS